MRYRYYVTDTKVVCVSSYAGKPVRGIAKCDVTQDTFDLEKGKELAKMRCDKKIAEKRYKRALQKREEAIQALAVAREHARDMQRYLDESFMEYAEITEVLLDKIKSM